VASPPTIRAILEQLASQQLSCGGWAYRRETRQAALEPTALALLALKRFDSRAWDDGIRFLLKSQNPNGSWPACEGDDPNGSWTTALALLALYGVSDAAYAPDRAWRWLLESKGRESDWLWKWKFRTSDRHVRFDPDKYGWPWMPDTNSWVVPTAFSLLALRQRFAFDREARAQFRMDRGVEMLLDRACPGGGWNAGNGVVYGEALAAHPDATAIALLSLTEQKTNPIVQQSLDWLERASSECAAPWSLAWAVIALTAHDRLATSPLVQLWYSIDMLATEDAATQATVALAFESLAGTKRLGVCP
jgi:hypothetical protein